MFFSHDKIMLGHNNYDIKLPSPHPVSTEELMKWNGISYLDKRLLQNIKRAYIFSEVTALVTMEDDFLLVGKNERGSLGNGRDESFFTKEPIRIETLCGQRICDFAIGVVKVTTNGDGDDSPILLSLFALSENGSVYSWGYNGHGNLGHRRSSDLPALPTKINFRDDSKIIQISSGAGHSLAVSQTGAVWGWGRNFFGQVGHGNRQDTPFPVQIKLDGERVVMVACGSRHSVALTDHGDVYTWGHNTKGQLGLSKRKDDDDFMVTPQKVVFSENIKIKKIACGKHHTLALTKDDGLILCWGSNRYGQLGQEDDDNSKSLKKSKTPVKVLMNEAVADIAAIAYHSISVCETVSRKVYMWGKLPEINGKVVDQPWETFMNSMLDVFSSFAVPVATFKPISGPPSYPTIDLELDTIQQNGPFDLTLNVPGELMKWSGLKYIDQKLLSEARLAFVCGAGFEQTAILVTRNDEVFFVGNNVHGSLGTGEVETFDSKTPRLLGGEKKTTNFGLDVVGGCMCIFALTDYGQVYAWGYNEVGEMGIGFTSDQTVPVPVKPTRIKGDIESTRIRFVTCGSDHVLAISEEDALYAWGYNAFGQLGTGWKEYCDPHPKRVKKFRTPNTKIKYAAGGMFHSVACTVEGHVYAWGKNDHGQLARKAKANDWASVPFFVKLPVAVEKVVCGPNCVLALSLSKNSLWFWGHDGASDNECSTPVQVCRDIPVVDVATAHWSSIYACITQQKTVYMWGKTKGNKKMRETPMEVPTATSIADVFAMYSNPPCTIDPIVLD